MNKITPVILSGGSGTRLWPMSTAERPKQFLPLLEEQSIFEMTLARVADRSKFQEPVIVGNARHTQLIDQALASQNAIETACRIFEPCARNTAPAIALAALAAKQIDDILLVMPSDHLIADIPAFHKAIAEALPVAQDGALVTFGIHPTSPETGYGYIRMGDTLSGSVRRVDRFIEKPARDVAEAMLAQGSHAWNGGIFLFRADSFLTELAQYAPDVVNACAAAIAKARHTEHAIYPDMDSFALSPSDSIDYAVMEKSDKVAVAPVDMGWSDVGSWDALAELAPTEQQAESHDSMRNYVLSDGLHIHLAGVEDLIIVASGDRVLITRKGESQQVKYIAEALKR